MTKNSKLKDSGRLPLEDPQARLERAFIEEFLVAKGHHLKGLHLLPKAKVRALMVEACIYASNKLAEIETRSALVNELHGTF